MAAPTWWKRTWPPPSELALAALVTVAMTVDLGQAARPALALLLVIPAGLSLAWRLPAPLVPLGLTCAADLALQATAPGQYGPQTVVFGVLVALYTAASQLPGRRAIVVGAASLAAVWASFVVTAEGDVADFFAFLVWGVPWSAGRLVRRQTLQAKEAGARAALLEVEAREATGRERDRIARELHDVVAHAVSLMVVQAGAERLALKGVEPRTRGVLDTIETTGRQALVELRAMLGVLRCTDGHDGHDDRAPQPDLTAIPALLDSVRAAGLTVDATIAGDATVPAGVGLAAYRIVQEALTNALRYGGGAAEVRVLATDALTIEVRNLMGHASSPGVGKGLIGMRERVELFGGSLRAGEVEGEWVVAAELPLRRVGAA